MSTTIEKDNRLNQPIRILLIGPQPPPIGGTSTLFAQLLSDLKKIESVETRVVNISRGRINKSFISYVIHGLRVLVSILRQIRRVDIISFHCSLTGAIWFSPVVHCLSRIYRKPWIFRKFGGVFAETYGQLPHLIKLLVDQTALSADLCLFETQDNTTYFKQRCKKTVSWFPNNRPYDLNLGVNIKRVSCRHFIFCSHVMPSKGIHEIIWAGEHLPTEIDIDVFGPLLGNISEDLFAGLKRVHYRGVLKPEEVLSHLKRYDALLLPTYHFGEGYPGIILEAYAAGIPVITTKWKSIPEIVDETSGLLIEPRNAKQLLEAMQQLTNNNEIYQELCLGAVAKCKQFSSKFWAEKFVSYCKILL